MIQRIQTVYFAVAALFISLPLFGMDLFTFSSNGELVHVTPFKAFSEKTALIDFNQDFALQLVLILFLLIIIFSFKNRKRQIFLGWLSFTLSILTAGWMVLGAYVKSSVCTMCNTTSPVPAIGFHLFLPSIVLILLGIFAVRKDKKLIDSLNRLR